jgi:hypothetical protein
LKADGSTHFAEGAARRIEEDVMPDTIPAPAVGDPAPPIDGPDTQGGRFKLSDHLGSWVVVYFYPRANTPG